MNKKHENIKETLISAYLKQNYVLDQKRSQLDETE